MIYRALLLVVIVTMGSIVNPGIFELYNGPIKDIDEAIVIPRDGYMLDYILRYLASSSTRNDITILINDTTVYLDDNIKIYSSKNITITGIGKAAIYPTITRELLYNTINIRFNEESKHTLMITNITLKHIKLVISGNVAVKIVNSSLYYTDIKLPTPSTYIEINNSIVKYSKIEASTQILPNLSKRIIITSSRIENSTIESYIMIMLQGDNKLPTMYFDTILYNTTIRNSFLEGEKIRILHSYMEKTTLNAWSLKIRSSNITRSNIRPVLFHFYSLNISNSFFNKSILHLNVLEDSHKFSISSSVFYETSIYTNSPTIFENATNIVNGEPLFILTGMNSKVITKRGSYIVVSARTVYVINVSHIGYLATYDCSIIYVEDSEIEYIIISGSTSTTLKKNIIHYASIESTYVSLADNVVYNATLLKTTSLTSIGNKFFGKLNLSLNNINLIDNIVFKNNTLNGRQIFYKKCKIGDILVINNTEIAGGIIIGCSNLLIINTIINGSMGLYLIDTPEVHINNSILVNSEINIRSLRQQLGSIDISYSKLINTHILIPKLFSTPPNIHIVHNKIYQYKDKPIMTIYRSLDTFIYANNIVINTRRTLRSSPLVYINAYSILIAYNNISIYTYTNINVGIEKYILNTILPFFSLNSLSKGPIIAYYNNISIRSIIQVNHYMIDSLLYCLNKHMVFTYIFDFSLLDEGYVIVVNNKIIFRQYYYSTLIDQEFSKFIKEYISYKRANTNYDAVKNTGLHTAVFALKELSRSIFNATSNTIYAETFDPIYSKYSVFTTLSSSSWVPVLFNNNISYNTLNPLVSEASIADLEMTATFGLLMEDNRFYNIGFSGSLISSIRGLSEGEAILIDNCYINDKPIVIISSYISSTPYNVKKHYPEAGAVLVISSRNIIIEGYTFENTAIPIIIWRTVNVTIRYNTFRNVKAVVYLDYGTVTIYANKIFNCWKLYEEYPYSDNNVVTESPIELLYYNRSDNKYYYGILPYNISSMPIDIVIDPQDYFRVYLNNKAGIVGRKTVLTVVGGGLINYTVKIKGLGVDKILSRGKIGFNEKKNITLNLSSISDGRYRLVFCGYIVLLNRTGCKAFSITLDNTPPKIIIQSFSSQKEITEQQKLRISYKIVDQYLENASIIILDYRTRKILYRQSIPFNGTQSIDLSKFSEGKYVLTIMAIDKAGNIANKTIIFVYYRLGQINYTYIALGIIAVIAIITLLYRKIIVRRKK